MKFHQSFTGKTTDGVGRRTILQLTVTTMFCWLILVLAQAFGPLPVRAQAQENRQQPLFWEERASKGRQELAPRYRDAIVEALRTVAIETEVVLCLDEEGGSTDPAFESVCLQRDEKSSSYQTLRWNASVNVTSHYARKIVIVTLAMDVHASKKRKRKAPSWPESNNLITQTEVFSSEMSPAQRDNMVPKAIYDMISKSPDIRRWFDEMRFFQTFLFERPAGEFSPPASRYSDVAETPATTEPSSDSTNLVSEEQRQRWEMEKEAIVDLLIDDQPEEARDRAAALLDQEGLPEDLSRRVEDLLEKAEETLVEGVETTDETESEEPGDPEPVPEPFDVTVKVRFVKAGEGGFRNGVDGRLRVSRRGIRFVPEERAHGDGWSVKWSSFKSVGPATGQWDVAYPLVIETAEGKKYYLTKVTLEGRYGKGEDILKYIEKGRKGG